MDSDDLVAICRSIVEAGKMARPDMTDIDLSGTNSVLREIVSVLRDIDAELTNIKHELEDLATAVRDQGE